MFDYCDVVWGNLDQGLATKLEKLRNRVARTITFQGYDVRSAQIRKQNKLGRTRLKASNALKPINV